MSNSKCCIKIKDKNIPVIIRNYKNTKNIKIFFRDDILNISKPKWYSINKIIREYGESIYKKYIEIIAIENNNVRHWLTGEKILYIGKEFKIIRNTINSNKISIHLDEESQILNISLPALLKDENDIRENVTRAVKKLFKNNTSIILQEKLKFWSEKMSVSYTSYKVNDTSSKYGSCMPKTKRLFFSLRLVMLPEDILDLIVVHELSHIIHPNHSKDFYDLVKKYICDYDKKDKWLKDNCNLIRI